MHLPLSYRDEHALDARLIAPRDQVIRPLKYICQKLDHLELCDKLFGPDSDAQPRQGIVAIHHHMHERVERAAVVRLSARAIVDIERPDGEEGRGVVVDVQEGDLRKHRDKSIIAACCIALGRIGGGSSRLVCSPPSH